MMKKSLSVITALIITLCMMTAVPLPAAAETDPSSPIDHAFALSGWTWDGYEAATALFICSDCGDEHTEEAVITTSSQFPCDCTYTATVVFAGKTFTDEKMEVNHQWEWQSDESRHWRYCPLCGVHTRTLSHEKGDVRAHIEVVTDPLPILGSISGNPVYVLFVTVYGECSTCQRHFPINAYSLTHTFDLNLYRLAERRHCVISKSGNAIFIESSSDQPELAFWDGVLIDQKSDDKAAAAEKGSVILHFDEAFLASAEDGDHELIVLKGDEFTVMTVTVKDRFLVKLSEKDYNDLRKITPDEYGAQCKDYKKAGAEIIDADLDKVLPLSGDADGDGDISVVDATWIQRKLAHMNVGYRFDLSVCDVDGDGCCGILDATAIQRWLTNPGTSPAIGKPTPGSDVIIS